MLGFEPRISILETVGLPLAYIPGLELVHAVGLAPTKSFGRLIYSQALLLLSHACKKRIFELRNCILYRKK
jgi:hypothetical protein